MNFFTGRSKSVGNPPPPPQSQVKSPAKPATATAVATNNAAATKDPLAGLKMPPPKPATTSPGLKSSSGLVNVNSKDSADNNALDDGGDRISLSRSDNVTQDLVQVFAKPGFSDTINTSTKVEEPPHKDEDEHAPISIPRSDGLTHDIIKVFKAQSDAHLDKVRIKQGRALSVGKLDLSGISFGSLGKGKKEDDGGGGGGAGSGGSGAGRSSGGISGNTTNNIQSSSLQGSGPGGQNMNIAVDRQISALYYPKSVRIVHYSDTHNFLIKNPKNEFLPHGDILIHTGNFTNGGTDMEFLQFNDWLGSVTGYYHYRVVIFGHRDVKIYGNNWEVMKKLLTNATHVLCHEEATVLGIRIYGAPWHWGHKVNYTVRPGAPLTTNGRFDDIPYGIQVLLTHGPAYDRLDTTYGPNGNEHWGSRELADALRRVKPALHMHGHVKDCRGIFPAFGNNPLTVNSSMVDPEVSVLYTTPHVVRATQAFFDKSKNIVTWAFRIDSLEG